jgi:hypothetical protein
MFLRTVLRLYPISNTLSITSYEYATYLSGSSKLRIASEATNRPRQSTLSPILYTPEATFAVSSAMESVYSCWICAMIFLHHRNECFTLISL